MRHENLHSVFQELAVTSATRIHPSRLAFSFSDGIIMMIQRYRIPCVWVRLHIADFDNDPLQLSVSSGEIKVDVPVLLSLMSLQFHRHETPGNQIRILIQAENLHIFRRSMSTTRIDADNQHGKIQELEMSRIRGAV